MMEHLMTRRLWRVSGTAIPLCPVCVKAIILALLNQRVILILPEAAVLLMIAHLYEA